LINVAKSILALGLFVPHENMTNPNNTPIKNIENMQKLNLRKIETLGGEGKVRWRN
jgi:hypothetical protein